MKNLVNTGLALKSLWLVFMAITIYQPLNCLAEDTAESLLTNDPQKLSRGIGHFEKSRSLLLAAIREFDNGYNYVKTDQVLDATAWRKTLLARAEELETILSPKPREIKAGSRYEPDSRILGPRTKPPAKIVKNPTVSTADKIQPEAKIAKPEIEGKESLDLDVSGS